MGDTPFGVTIAAGTVYAWNSREGTVSLINAVTILNGARCNATVTAGCGTAREQPVGSAPLTLAIDQGSHTVYVTNLFGSGSMSVFRTAAP